MRTVTTACRSGAWKSWRGRFNLSVSSGEPGRSVLTAESFRWRKMPGLAAAGCSFWMSGFCQAAVNPGSRVLRLPINQDLLVQRKPDRHAKGSPIRGAVAAAPATERFHKAKMTERFRNAAGFCAAPLKYQVPAPLSRLPAATLFHIFFTRSAIPFHNYRIQ